MNWIETKHKTPEEDVRLWVFDEKTVQPAYRHGNVYVNPYTKTVIDNVKFWMLGPPPPPPSEYTALRRLF